ncbi:hypothetical protein [Pararobbsia alpina]|uniref:hypothetical protein n=1 Tax=Pararobbsia alpina TaxID=621374 RepID=UPI0039A5FB1C
MPKNLQISQPDAALFKAASNALNTAKAYEIDSHEMRDLAAGDLVKVKAKQKELEAHRKSLTQPLDAVKNGIMDIFRAPTAYLEQAETILKKAIGDYDRDEERKRIAEQARLEEAARVERARLAAEAAAREAAALDEARKIQAAADEAAAAGKAEEAARLAAEAESRAEQGAAEVETLQQTAALVTAPIATAARKSAGVSTRKVWRTEVNDKLALIRYVAAHPEYAELLEPNMPAINKLGLALKAACPIEGVRVFEDAVLAARAA